MNDVERIINNVDATMNMENMPLTNEDKQMLKNCLEGEISFDEALNHIISKHTHLC